MNYDLPPVEPGTLPTGSVPSISPAEVPRGSRIEFTTNHGAEYVVECLGRDSGWLVGWVTRTGIAPFDALERQISLSESETPPQLVRFDPAIPLKIGHHALMDTVDANAGASRLLTGRLISLRLIHEQGARS